MLSVTVINVELCNLLLFGFVMFPQTTIMAVAFKDGVVLGADSRTSMGKYAQSRPYVKTAHCQSKFWTHLQACKFPTALATRSRSCLRACIVAAAALLRTRKQ